MWIKIRIQYIHTNTRENYITHLFKRTSHTTHTLPIVELGLDNCVAACAPRFLGVEPWLGYDYEGLYTLYTDCSEAEEEESIYSEEESWSEAADAF